MSENDIAIVGMSIRCPGARDITQFWDNLTAGRESISFFAPDEIERSAFLPVDVHDPLLVPAAGIVDDADLFDAAFFGISRGEAQMMDPQHRVFLEAVWHAMEDSGHDLTSYDGNVSVYAGSASNTYLLSLFNSRAGSRLRSYQGLVGNEKDYLATRVSYKLNLTGEAITVQTACSTSLVAVHLACQSLLSGQSDIAIAGGVSVQAHQKTGYIYQEDAIFSPDGHCRAFDRAGRGTVFSNGTGVVVLRPLADALRDNDRIYAVIKGSYVNNDAAAKVSYTAPSVVAQAGVVAGALAFADVDARTLGYVEGHGTGTVLGDPIEVAGLTKAFREYTADNGFCALGSVKTNIGHLNVAAGVAGLIKAALAVHHGQIPATLNFTEPNPQIGFDATPFFVNAGLLDWPRQGHPRRAGVSSFGIGGTNAHAVLEQAPAPLGSTPAAEVQTLVLSAPTRAALAELALVHADAVAELTPQALADHCHTTHVSRRSWSERLAVQGDAAAIARSLRDDPVGRAVTALNAPTVAFMFTGQGAWTPGVGRALLAEHLGFRRAFQECADLLGVTTEALLGQRDPAHYQAGLFALEWSLVRVWQDLGVTCDIVIGHSLGEYVAATVAGGLTLADGLRLAWARGRLMGERTEPGAMATVFAELDVVEPALAGYADRVGVAALNAPGSVVLSGEPAALDRVLAGLAAEGVHSRALPGGLAFHSPLMEPVLAPFAEELAEVPRRPLTLPLVSTTDGRARGVGSVLPTDYWVEQIRQPVRFADGLLEIDADVFVEIGPAAMLTRIGRRVRAGVFVATCDGDEADDLRLATATLHTLGVPVRLDGLAGVGRRRRSVPAYPFQRQRFWMEDDEQPAAPTPTPTVEPPSTATSPAGIVTELRELMASLLGTGTEEVDPTAKLLEIGIDSLIMLDAMQVIKTRYGVELKIRQLLTDVNTVERVAAFVYEAQQGAADPRFVPFKPITVADEDGSDGQRARLRGFVGQYARRTAGSKALAQRYRPVLADNDNRVVSDFRMSIKEMQYPIALDRSAGSRIWDVDGNEYVDVVLGYGVNLLGHAPAPVTDAIRAQLDRGVHIGGQSALAGRVAELTCRMTGMDRVVFCNSGSEAVMNAIRLARARTGRRKVAMFAGSYHGTFDGTLGRRQLLRPDLGPVPIAPGVAPGLVNDLLILEYGSPEALRELEQHAGELAGVLVEPVQSRRPDFQPREFLHALRELTSRVGAALIFDEIITGFRMHPGGAQAVFDVRADLAAYGKVLGGGMPIGAVAGRADYLDAIDGGQWNYGDDSYPSADTTFFAGTFCKHPLAMSAALAVLTELDRQGPELQRRLAELGDGLALRLNGFLDAAGAPLRVVNCGSLFRFVSQQDIHLLYYHLVHRGVHIREGHNAFLSVAHTEDDLDRIASAVEESVDQLGREGFLAVTGTRDEHPLTAAQRQLWVLSRLSPDASRAYEQHATLVLDGPLDRAALQSAFATLVERHEALRTVFTEDGLQRVRPTMPAPVEFDTEAATTTPFDLTTGPLCRLVLTPLGPDRHRLLLRAHHLVADGVSMGLLLDELATAYSAAVAGQPARLPVAQPFRRYARALARLDDTVAADYWLGRFATEPTPLDLPTDRRRPRVKTFAGARLHRDLDATLADRLRRTASEQDLTVFMLLFSGFAALLHRLTGQTDLTIGVPSSGRAVDEARHTVGHCVNLLPVRVPVRAGGSFAELATAAKAELLGAYEHQMYPFADLVERLGPTLDPSRSPLVDVTFNVDRFAHPASPAGLVARTDPHPAGFAQFELELNVVLLDDDMRLELTYNTDLFDEDNTRAWLASYERLLTAVVAEPAAPLREIALVATPSPPVRRELSADTVFDAFAARVAVMPDAVCLRQGHDEITYRGLDQLADGVAARLVAEGVVPGAVVGVRMPRGIGLVASALGVLKVGACYLPLDPALPEERLDRLVADSGAAVVLTEVTADTGSAPAHRGAPTDVAYLIYTSGSTGAPKGVLGTQQGVVNRLDWMAREHPFVAGEVCCQKTATGFVDSVWEIFGPLIAGVPSVILDDATVRDPRLLARAVAEHGITRIVLVPTLLGLLLEVWDSVGPPESLRMVVTSGEPVSPAMARRTRTLLPRVTLLNLYGSTETAADSTAFDCAGLDPAAGSVPVGRAITGQAAYVLDGDLCPAPVGALGDLYVAGVGLARGYHGRVAETAARFVPDPFHGGRMYRTGDLARLRGDGTIEIIGRADDQVKIRGMRVEPGEVEAALLACPWVASATVVVRSSTREQQLVAFVVPGPGTEADERDYRRFLAGRLPDFMIPSRIVRLDALPRNANGKVDRQALSAADLPDAAPLSAREPTGPVEEAMAAIWCEVLELTSCPVDDSLLDLGGNSLTALRLLTRVRQQFGVEVTHAELFAAPTVAGLAAVVESMLLASDDVDELLRWVERLDEPEPAGHEEER